jgi:hypothetical protein
MIEGMLQKMGFGVLLLSAVFLVGCGISSPGPDGSRHQTETGVSETGYPGGQPVDSESPALSTSSEQKYSHDEASIASAGEATSQPAK